MFIIPKTNEICKEKKIFININENLNETCWK